MADNFRETVAQILRDIETASTAALPAGDNTIGKVEQDGTWTVTVSTLPALPAGGNVIGSVGQNGSWSVAVSTLPALPAGGNVIGDVGQDGTWNINHVSGTIALPTGAATAANQTTANGSLSSIDGKLQNGLITTCTPSSASITTTSSTAIAGNSSRVSLVITNIGSVAVTLRRSSSTATAGEGIVLNPGGSYEINSTNLYKGAITAITASGSSTLAIEEGV